MDDPEGTVGLDTGLVWDCQLCIDRLKDVDHMSVRRDGTLYHLRQSSLGSFGRAALEPQCLMSVSRRKSRLGKHTLSFLKTLKIKINTDDLCGFIFTKV